MDLRGGPVHSAVRQRDGQQRLDAGAAAGQIPLHRVDVDVVVMHGVQRGGGGRGHPGGAGAGPGLGDLLRHHVGHQIGHRPHALADLGPSGEAGGQADVDVAILVGEDPGLRLHRTLADHRAGFHRGVDLVAGAVQEPGVDEGHAIGNRLHAGFEVDRGATFLVHDADLDGVVRQAQDVLDPAEQLAGERHLLGAVHLRLDDVDRTGPAVAQRAVAVAAAQAVHGDQAGEQCVLDALGHLVAVGVDDRVVGHQVPDIADEEQAAPGQDQVRSVRCGEDPVAVQHPGDGALALADLFGQVAAVQAQPVAVAEHLVLGVHRGHRVLEVHDRGDRGLQHHVGDSGRIGRADRGVRVDQDLQM